MYAWIGRREVDYLNVEEVADFSMDHGKCMLKMRKMQFKKNKNRKINSLGSSTQ
jgi:hypothetical protein